MVESINLNQQRKGSWLIKGQLKLNSYLVVTNRMWEGDMLVLTTLTTK